MQLDDFSNGLVLSLLYNLLSLGDRDGRGHIGFGVDSGYLRWGRCEGIAINFKAVPYIRCKEGSFATIASH